MSLLVTNYTLPENESEKIQELANSIQIISSISPHDTSFEDLEFLKATLKNTDIVMLGEQTHYDGATFLAKARLIKFLHQKLGFDVLIYETGLYDTENLWESLKSNPKDGLVNFTKAFYPFWCKNQENEEILKYILKNINTENEIKIAGLDVQFSGDVEDNERDSILNQYLKSKPKINAKQFPAFFSIKDKYSYYAKKWIARKLTPTKRDSILNNIRSINSMYFSDSSQNKEDLLYARFFRNIETLYSYSWYYNIGEDIRFHIRDSAMADNFIWLKENKFKNKKVIIWAANLHTSYSNDSYNPIISKFKPMGAYIKEKYLDRCYSINFTSFSNANNLSRSDKLYNNKSVEYLLHKLNIPYLFFDFNQIDSTSFLRNEIIMNCNQRLSFNAKWCKITDGTIIQTTDLEFSFGKEKVINKLCLEVPKNSIYGFLGPNGAGKSTTIKLLLGLLHSPRNNIFLFEKDLKNHRNEILGKVGNLIESPTIYRNLTGRENLLYLNKIYREKSTRIEEVLKIIGLWENRNKKVSSFSTGMKQRLGIGMAIFHNPELVILDEPVNGLDPSGIFEIRELLLKLQNEGKTIFISSHILSEIEKLCSHVGIIKKGSMLFQGEINALTSKTQKRFEIKTNNNTLAIELLKKHQYSVEIKNNAVIEIEVDNQTRFNELISTLVTNQIKIYDIEKKSTNLEDVFINLTLN